MKRFAVLLAAVILSGSRAGASEVARLDATATVQSFREALRAGEGERALAFLAPDVVVFEAGGAELSRDEYATHHLTADMEFSRAVRSETVSRQGGGSPDTAWVLTRYRTKGIFRDKQIDSEETETMVLRDTPAGWRIVHIHWSSHRANVP